MYLSSNWPTYPALIQVGPGPLWKASWAGCIRFFTGHKYPPAAQLTASKYWKYNKIRLVPDLTKQCIKGSTELYCLFIAADNIVDTISFIRCIVLQQFVIRPLIGNPAKFGSGSGQMSSRIWPIPVQLQYIPLIMDKTNTVDRSSAVFPILISVIRAIKKQIQCRYLVKNWQTAM